MTNLLKYDIVSIQKARGLINMKLELLKNIRMELICKNLIGDNFNVTLFLPEGREMKGKIEKVEEEIVFMKLASASGQDWGGIAPIENIDSIMYREL